MAENIAVRTEVDLQGIAADLDSVALGLGREVAQVVRTAGETILAALPQFTPYDPADQPTGGGGRGQHLRDSFSLTTSGGTTLRIVSSHPGALVHEYGGTIAPHGSDITIHEAAMAHHAAEAEAPAYVGVLNARVNELLAAHGL